MGGIHMSLATFSRCFPASVRRCFLPRSALLLIVMLAGSVANAATATTTTLAVSPSTSPVAAKTVVTLTATVVAGATPVSPGLVTFCDTSLTSLPTPTGAPCAGLAVVGEAQLTSTGIALLKYVPGGGSHSYKAVFAGTTAYTTSTSTAQALTVSVPPPPSATTITFTSSGSPGNYTLMATVVGYANVALTGNVSFFDTTNSNILLGTAPLGASTPALGFVNGPTSPVAVGGLPWSEAVGDFNGDGIADLAVANNNTNTVAILLGDGSGNFTPAPGSPAAVGSQPYGVAVGDFNGDGIQDLAVTNYNGHSVTILLGDGTGRFTPALGSPVSVGNNPISAAVGDFNGDGIQDLAVSNNNSNNVSILLGDGTGRFVNAAGSPVASGGTNAEFVTIGDFNGDGIQDLAVANYNSRVGILLGNGSGGFAPAPGSPVTIGSGAAWVAVGDFNGDGIQDLATANSTSNNVSVLLGNGSGGFTQAPGSPVAVGGGAHGVVVADFDGDGIADVATANGGANNVSVLRGNGNGTFTAFAGSPVALGVGPNNLAVGSFDGLSSAELTTANTSASNVSILLYTITETAMATLTGVKVPGSGTHDVDAGYPGDTNYSNSTSTTIPLTATPIPTTLALTAAPTSSTYGQQVVLTATLSSTPPYPVGSLTPTGTVTFFSNGAQIGTGTVTSGVTTLNITSLPAGTLSLTAVYGGDTNFVTSTSAALPFVVSKGTPVITWANPAAITYGTALSATQLNATANVPGTFVYSPTMGAVLSAGTQTLNVTFTPTDTTDYTTATASVTLVVNKATLTVTAANASRFYGDANPTFTDTITGFVNGDTATVVTGAASLTTTATTTSPARTYAITAALGTLAAANYTFTFVNGTLTVTKATPGSGGVAAVTVASSVNPSTYGTAVTFTGTVPAGATGTVQFLDGTTVLGTGTISGTTASFSTSALAVASHPITAVYSGDGNYNGATSAVLTQVVNQATLTVTANSLSRAYGVANPALTYTITGFVNGDTASVVTGSPTLTTTATTASSAGTYPIAVALGTLATNNNYTFTFANGTLMVTQAVGVSTTLTVAPPTVMYGDAAVLTAVVGPQAGATGTVSFYDGTTLLGTASLNGSATAVLSVSTLNVGTHMITAKYNGDVNFPASTSNAATLTVTQRTAAGGGPALTVTVNDASRTTTQANPVFSYTVAGTLVNGDTYAGAVTGTPSYSTAAKTTPGTFAIMVTGLSSANYLIAFVPGTLTVVPATTTTTLATSPSLPQYGDPVTLTATVTSGTTGTVSFYDGTTYLGQGTVSGGVATLTTTTLNAGTHTITAIYNGDATYASSTSGPATVTVAKKTAAGGGPALTVTVVNASREFGTSDPQFAYVVSGTLVNTDTYAAAVTGVPVYAVTDTPSSPVGSTFPISVSGLVIQNYTVTFISGNLTIVTAPTTTALMTSAASTQYGGPVTLTATVAPSAATGTVVFSNGSTVLGTATLSGGVATLTTSALNAGTYTITAAYHGDGNYGASTSSPVTVTVAQKTGPGGGAALTITVANASRQYGQGNPAFTYTVSGTLVNGDTYATAVTGVPVFSTAGTVTSPVGTYPISLTGGLSSLNYTIAFVNDTLTVSMGTPLVTVSSSSNPSTYSASVTFTAAVSGGATGTVTFMDGVTVLGTGTVSGGTASFSTTTLSVGTHSITAVYSGDPNYNGATSAVLSQVVNKATSGIGATPPTTIASSLNPAPAGTAVTLTATVPAGATGSVSFYDGTTLLGTATISGGKASFTTSALGVGTHSITAVYGGDANYNGATSAVFSQVVVSLADFTVASSTGRQLIPPGASASYNIVVSSVNAPFTNLVTMTASNLPSGATYTYTPATVTPGAAGANTAFTVSVPKQSAALHTERLGPTVLALLALPLAWSRRSRGRLHRLLLWLVALASLGAVTGCGAGGYFSQTEQTYTITVTGTSGSLVHSTTVTLTVE
jgi:hypothetical protein